VVTRFYAQVSGQRRIQYHLIVFHLQNGFIENQVGLAGLFPKIARDAEDLNA
jgi:hypothetical protein